MACEFRVGTFTYRARSMDAFTQMSVAAKISPLVASGFAELLPFALKLAKTGVKNVADLPMKEATAMFAPVARELAKMPEEDRRFVISSCLSLCERQKDGANSWEPIWNHAAHISQQRDIQEDAVIMLRITIGVIHGTLANFSLGDLSDLFA